MRRTALLTVLLAVLALPTAAGAGGGGGGFGGCNGFWEGDEVLLRDSCFEATAHFADDGPVTVVNDGELDHSYTAVDGAFDTGNLASGERAEIDPEPGIHRVYCTLHASPDGDGMSGVLIVGDPDLAAAGVPAADRGSALPGLLAAGGILAAAGLLVVARRQRTVNGTG